MAMTASAVEPGLGRGAAVERLDDHRDRADDRRDLRVLIDATARWNTAIQTGDRAAEQAADTSLRTWLQQELRESRRDVGEARREVQRSNRELQGSRVERAVEGGAKDGHDVRDDRRDRRDDVVDRGQARMDLARTRQIADALAGMQPRFDAGTASAADVVAKRGLLNELRGMAYRELGESGEELREDRREGREDRRERRE
ncbi:MAG: hypothetical protein H6734_04515 [Alphaproteobacteria bacterium]|nr:hypothetical protein [Alphaproteobacteria bacterium]